MGKKREREEATIDRDGDGGSDRDREDGGAESLMFKIVASDDTSRTSSKRRKSSSSLPPPQGPSEDVEKDDAADVLTDPGFAATGGGDRGSKYHPAAIAPSSALRQCDGFDVVRKGARGRGRQLMVLPGALGLGNGCGGGRLGALNIATPANPVLYVEFPQGRLKCTGRTVHTKGRFFTLYGDKASGRATRVDCRDVFDSVVFFSKACWVGKKGDNPSEEPLPLPESLQEEGDAEASGENGGGKVTAADFKTHFGGGVPGSLMSGESKTNASAGSNSGGGGGGGAGVAAGKGGGGGCSVGEEGEGADQSGAESKAPARRVSSRSTKSTATYVEDSDDEESGGGGSGSSSSSSDGEDGGGAGEEAGGDEDVVAVRGSIGKRNGVGGGDGGGSSGNGKGKGKGEGSVSGSGSGGVVEVFSILDAPTAKRKPVTFGSGKETKNAAAKPRKKKQAGGGGTGKGKGRRRTLAESSASSSSDSDDDGGGGGGDSGDGGGAGEDSDEASAASGEDVAAAAVSSAPSRRSCRASAVSRVKYTQSSGSEEEEEEEEEEGGGDGEEDDEFEL